MSPEQKAEWDKRGTCEKRTVPTKEEIAAYEATAAEHTSRFMKCLPLINQIKKEHKGKTWRGTLPCPVCNGKLLLSHAAYNGHVWGKCETENCVSWME